MANTVKLKDGSYIDSSGVYDTTQKKTVAAAIADLDAQKSRLLNSKTYTVYSSTTATASNTYLWEVAIALEGYTVLLATEAHGGSSTALCAMEGWNQTLAKGYAAKPNTRVEVSVLYLKNS